MKDKFRKAVENKDEQELMTKWRSEKLFKPNMLKTEQSDILEQWKHAIKAVLKFDDL